MVAKSRREPPPGILLPSPVSPVQIFNGFGYIYSLDFLYIENPTGFPLRCTIARCSWIYTAARAFTGVRLNNRFIVKGQWWKCSLPTFSLCRSMRLHDQRCRRIAMVSPGILVAMVLVPNPFWVSNDFHGVFQFFPVFQLLLTVIGVDYIGVGWFKKFYFSIFLVTRNSQMLFTKFMFDRYLGTFTYVLLLCIYYSCQNRNILIIY